MAFLRRTGFRVGFNGFRICCTYQALVSVTRSRLPVKRSSDVVDNICRATIGIVQTYQTLALFRFQELINIQYTMLLDFEFFRPYLRRRLTEWVCREPGSHTNLRVKNVPV